MKIELHEMINEKREKKMGKCIRFMREIELTRSGRDVKRGEMKGRQRQ